MLSDNNDSTGLQMFHWFDCIVETVLESWLANISIN